MKWDVEIGITSKDYGLKDSISIGLNQKYVDEKLYDVKENMYHKSFIYVFNGNFEFYIN